jgi:hypothetical protein
MIPPAFYAVDRAMKSSANFDRLRVGFLGDVSVR